MKLLYRKKNLFAFFSGLSILFILSACSADRDEFGKSDYRILKNIAFKNQLGSSAVYEQDRLVKVTLEVSKTPDSLILESFDLSSLAKLYLVKTKIDSIPADSLTREYWDEKVEISKNYLKTDEKIALPKENKIYLAVVSESGLRKIWEIQVTLRITEISSSSSASSGNSSSSTVTNSSSSTSISSSSSIPEDYPSILSVTANTAQSVSIQGEKIYIELDYLEDLSQVKIDEIELSEGAEISGITAGNTYDLRKGVTAEVTNSAGSVTYLFKAGVQLPGREFNDWNSNDLVIDPQYGNLWDNGNMTLLTATTSVVIGSGYGAEMKTNFIANKTASGSLFTGDFNPKNVTLFAMADKTNYPDGNALIDLGKPFTARPEYLEVKFAYEGLSDSCDIYLLLENRTGNKNKDRTATDENKLVASAWFRAADESDKSDPDVVSISEPDANGMRTLLLKVQYGTPLAGSPILDDKSPLGLPKPSKGIDNSVSQGTGEEEVTHIRLVFASSAKGNLYEGIKGATLIVDEFKFIY